jgi:hypothetical protein
VKLVSGIGKFILRPPLSREPDKPENRIFAA